MTQNELITAIQAQINASNPDSKLSKTDIKAVIDATADQIINACKNGDSIRIPALGTFKPAERKARTARNPRTGETVEVPAKTILTLKTKVTL